MFSKRNEAPTLETKQHIIAVKLNEAIRNVTNLLKFHVDHDHYESKWNQLIKPVNEMHQEVMNYLLLCKDLGFAKNVALRNNLRNFKNDVERHAPQPAADTLKASFKYANDTIVQQMKSLAKEVDTIRADAKNVLIEAIAREIDKLPKAAENKF